MTIEQFKGLCVLTTIIWGKQDNRAFPIHHVLTRKRKRQLEDKTTQDQDEYDISGDYNNEATPEEEVSQ